MSFFDDLLAVHGDSPRALDWSEAGQRDRFRVLREVGIEEGSSVLDVGCGLAHFYRYLKDEGFHGSYAGVDVSEKMIERAEAPTLAVVDALAGPLPTADYVVASGVLNLERWSNEADMRELLRRCYEACNKATAVNMLSSRAPKKRPERHYYAAEQVLTEAMTITPKVVLRHDYRDNDLTLYLRRKPA